MSEAARLALADLKPARIFTGSVETESLNFVKHYKARNKKTGEICYIGDNFGDAKNSELLAHATEVDPTLNSYKYTSYETDITRFAPGTGEKVVAKYVEMLYGLK